MCSHIPRVRDHLESSGALEKLIIKWTPKAAGPRNAMQWEHREYVLVLLGACAMTLGCSLRATFVQFLRATFTDVGLMSDALIQMDNALNGPDRYENGKPYDFQSPGLLETVNMRVHNETRTNQLGYVGMNVPAPHGLFAGPDTTALVQQIKARMAAAKQDKLPNVCGTCNAAPGHDANLLLACSQCKAVKYCSRDCQKKDWTMHKLLCKEAVPSDEVDSV